MVAPLFALSILLGYAFALWWLLRGEDRRALACLGALVLVTLATRLVWADSFPPGLYEDEPKVLWSAVQYLRFGHYFLQDSTGLPSLLSILFEAQLAEVIGPTRWAIRSYSILGSVLSVAAGYAAARSLRLSQVASLAAAGLIALLPWALFYGRVHQSGDMLFHELLVVAALARFLGGSGGLIEMVIGGISLSFLFYGYFSGRMLLGLALVSSVLARGRGRVLCLGVAAIALLGFLPYVLLSQSPHMFVGLSAEQTQGGLDTNPLATLARKTTQALAALRYPVAWDQWLTVRSAAIHPAVVLVLAFVGSLTGWRRALFLWAGFIGGLAPAILGNSPLPSTRRMLMAMPFLSLAAGAAFDLIPWRRARAALAVLVVAAVGVESTSFYFSKDFWPPESRATFDEERTRLVEAMPMPPHPRMIIDKGVSWMFSPRRLYDDTVETLAVENWLPRDGEETIYAFQPRNAALQDPYREVFGADRVERFGRAFIVRVPAGDWSALRRYGWTYEVQCGDTVRRGQVPALYHIETSFRGDLCKQASEHVWRGRWRGPSTRLTFNFQGRARAEVNGTTTMLNQREGLTYPFEGSTPYGLFDVRQGDDVAIHLFVPAGRELFAGLYMQDPRARVPALAMVEPLPEAAP